MPKKIKEKDLLQSWLHAHEEDTPTTTVFLPQSHPFPPSRGRTGYEFQPEGHLVEQGPGPTDRRQTSTGSWSLDEQNRLVLRMPGKPEQVLEIESLEPGRLVIKK